MELVYQGRKVRARQAIALAKPGLMRLETLNFLDQPLLILATDGLAFQAFSLTENRFFKGTVSVGISRFMHLPMNSDEFVSMILADVPLREDASLRYDAAKRLYELTFPPSTRWRTETFWVHSKTLRVLEILKIDAFSGEEIRISFSRFRRTDSVTFPGEIEIEVPAARNRVRLKFSSIAVNVPLPPELFRLSHPPGVEVVDMDHDVSRLFPASEGGKRRGQ